MAAPTLIGLDGEMSGPNLTDGHQLIQIGTAIRTNDTHIATFSSLICPAHIPDGWWSERAAQVHGFTQADVLAAPPAADVDTQLAQWLLAHGAVEGRRALIPVGFNVVGFDMPFVRATLPLTSALLSRRGVDLNAACFLLGGWDPQHPESARSWAGWKRSAKRAVQPDVETICAGLAAHDAGFDAVQALLIFEWLHTELRTPHRGVDRRTRITTDRLATTLNFTTDDAKHLQDAFTAAGITNPGKWLGQTAPNTTETRIQIIRREGIRPALTWLTTQTDG